MNRDFEFKQILRAYRAGIISEETFEAEMAGLEHGAGANGSSTAGFQALGKTYKSEREAIISFIDKARVAEANAGVAFTNWANVCTTDCIRSGLRMIAERENYHSRIFEQRMRDLGAECRATVSEESRKFTECASDAKMSDNDKLKEALKLFFEDELSSTKWLLYACQALNAPAQATSAQAAAQNSNQM
jgi:hypothetical protein